MGNGRVCEHNVCSQRVICLAHCGVQLCFEPDADGVQLPSHRYVRRELSIAHRYLVIRCDMITPTVLVVMGVSGSGKTTIATRLASHLGWELADGDDFHSADNIAKMASGTPLTDEDRRPWLRAIAGWIEKIRNEGRRGVVACSALKRRYREVLLDGHPDVRLVYLKGDSATIARRIGKRHGHFMPAALLQSQFDALEEPHRDENPIVVSVDAAPEAIIRQVLRAMRIHASRRMGA